MYARSCPALAVSALLLLACGAPEEDAPVAARAAAEVTVNCPPVTYADPMPPHIVPVPVYQGNFGCHVGTAPSGSTPFIYNNNFYIGSYETTHCSLGTYDGAHCLYRAIPPGGFIYQNRFYRPAVSPGVCVEGSWDGAHCLLTSAPPFTTPFAYQGSWYVTADKACQTGMFDGANCWMGNVPAGRQAFLFLGTRFRFTGP